MIIFFYMAALATGYLWVASAMPALSSGTIELVSVEPSPTMAIVSVTFFALATLLSSLRRPRRTVQMVSDK